MLAINVDAGRAPSLERFADGGLVEAGVGGGHLRAGMAEESLHDVLLYTLVDETCAVGKPETGVSVASVD